MAKSSKPSLLKLLTPIIIAALGAYATVRVTYMQTTVVSKTDLQKVNDATYEKHFVSIMETIQGMQKENVTLRERIAKLEGANEARLARRSGRIHHDKDKSLVEALKAYVSEKSKTDKEFKLDKLNVESMLEKQ